MPAKGSSLPLQLYYAHVVEMGFSLLNCKRGQACTSILHPKPTLVHIYGGGRCHSGGDWFASNGTRLGNQGKDDPGFERESTTADEDC